MREHVVDFEALKLATKYYSANQLSHALQVAEYAVESNRFLADEKDREKLWKLGLLHDILEDTSCPEKELQLVLTESEVRTIKLLTHDKKEQEYRDYILDIAESSNFYALAVKRADMKDHLSKEATLTDYLKDKYYPIIKYLL